MKKRLVCVMTVLFLCVLTACGSKKEAEEEAFSTLYIEKDGNIVGQIVEDFDEDYYDEDELKDMIQESVDAYNKAADGDDIEFKSCEKVDNAVAVKISYKTADDYTAFNGKTLFFGTVEEAYNAGYDLNLKMTDPVMNTTISKDDLLSMGDKHIVISDENVRIQAYSNVLYLSDGVELLNEKEAFLPASDSLGIVILK